MSGLDKNERLRRLGIRTWRTWRDIIREGENNGLSEDQIRGFVNGGGLFASDAERRELAAKLGFDWEGAADFFVTVLPIIAEMFAACAV